MKTISLTKGYEAIVDDDMYSHLSQWKWCAQIVGNRVYAVRTEKATEKDVRKKLLMHRVVMRVTDTKVHVDHIDLNTLNNTSSNLRTCTHSENLHNQGARNSFMLKGVSKLPSGKYWAKIGVGGGQMYLGTHKTPEAAALAYNEAAKKYHGEFARLNEV